MNFVNFPLVFDLIELLFRGYGVWCYFLFHLRYHTISLTSRHTNESVIKQKTYGKTLHCVASFRSNLQFVYTKHFTAVK